MRKILVIGSQGQIGSDLVPALREKYGDENIFATFHNKKPAKNDEHINSYIKFDVMDKAALEKIVKEKKIDTIYNMASILSATGEKMPQFAWKLNMEGLINVLEVAKNNGVKQVIWPSSIAAFGPTTPRQNTPNDTILQPSTMYGITKVAGELLAEYYYKKFGLDTRAMRLPGIISSNTLPGGGTTDYAVAIFYEAIKNKKYTCFVKEDTILPMLYQPDCIKCMIDLLEADESKLKHHIFNVTGMSFSVKELADEIKKHIPDFKINYKPDFRQDIADSWPMTIDDSVARKEWSWNPKFDLSLMVEDMLEKLKKKL